MAFTLETSALSGARSDGQSRSGDVQPCQLTRVVVPNDALFIHGSPATLPARTALRFAKNCVATEFATLNDLGAPRLTPRFCTTIVAVPSDHTSMR